MYQETENIVMMEKNDNTRLYKSLDEKSKFFIL